MQTNFTGEFKPFTKLDEFLLIYLKSYFENHPEFPWSENDAKSKIGIHNFFSIESEDNEFLPKIVIEPGPLDMTNYEGIGSSVNNGLLMDFTQTKDKAYKVGSVYFIRIIAKTPKQSKTLAEELTVMFAMYAEEIRTNFHITIEKHFNLQTGQPQMEGRNFKSSTTQLQLICSYVYYLSSRILPIYPKLANIDLVKEIDKKLDLNKIKFVTK